ncbi:hypothetical protein FN846DRAFT_903789 [Sphaerosporella brunnea]|uniref:Uncharacterized protein n=1 Tax=Sphaerosporella brunnea TaxID=1250544 RepID=A0A5J5F6R0_9PEZI|nr:hypothetical protein FN846DRAFT_903789 [Sphaerosporella brunnea]
MAIKALGNRHSLVPLSSPTRIPFRQQTATCLHSTDLNPRRSVRRASRAATAEITPLYTVEKIASDANCRRAKRRKQKAKRRIARKATPAIKNTVTTSNSVPTSSHGDDDVSTDDEMDFDDIPSYFSHFGSEGGRR